MNPQDDHEFLDRLAVGDSACLTDVLDRYYPRLVAFAARRLPRPMQTRLGPEDVVQLASSEFVLRVRAGGCRFGGWGDVEALLITLLKTAIRDQTRGNRRARRDVRREVSREDASDSGRSGPEPVERRAGPLQTATARDLLERLVAGLPDRHQRIIRDRVDGCTIEEIAQRQGCSPRLVDKVLAAARKRLADLGAGP